VTSRSTRGNSVTPSIGSVGSEEAPNEELASVRRTNRTYSFPVSGFHERAFEICSEGMSETRLTSVNSVRNRLVGYPSTLRYAIAWCDVTTAVGGAFRDLRIRKSL
jgi:hypothetical protein